MKELIILPPGSFSEKDYQRFGIEILKKNFSVKVLDCSAWIYKKHLNLFLKNVYKTKEYISITSRKDFINFISTINSPIVIDRLPINNKSNWIRMLLRRKKSLFVYLYLNLFPEKAYSNQKVFDTILNPRKVIKIFTNFLQKKIFNLIKSNSDILLIGGLASKKKLKNKNLIYAHSMDYDVYLSIKNKSLTNKNNYAVFVDENMVDHHDYFLLNLRPPATEEQYYETLRKFLKKFELDSQMKVKIAFHPKRQKKIPNLLKEFAYTFENTAEFVMNSKAVLAHSSTSISYAVLFRKPVIFLTSDEIKKSWQQPRIEKFSEALNGQIINMDQNSEKKLQIETLLKVDEKKYNDYLDQYIKVPDSPDIPIWEIFSQKIINKSY
tara:strand:+ start:744 stop:1883 length:1140 start_codon:yes stop_codon:yes gene_type:complete